MSSLVAPSVAPSPVKRATLYRVSVFHGGVRLMVWLVNGIGGAMTRAQFLAPKYEVVEIGADEGFVVAQWVQSK